MHCLVSTNLSLFLDLRQAVLLILLFLRIDASEKMLLGLLGICAREARGEIGKCSVTVVFQ